MASLGRVLSRLPKNAHGLTGTRALSAQAEPAAGVNFVLNETQQEVRQHYLTFESPPNSDLIFLVFGFG